MLHRVQEVFTHAWIILKDPSALPSVLITAPDDAAERGESIVPERLFGQCRAGDVDERPPGSVADSNSFTFCTADEVIAP